MRINLCLDPINPHSREGREITNAHPADNAEGGFPTSRNDEYLKEGLKPKNWTRNRNPTRSEEHTSELQSLMRISYAVFCLKKKNHTKTQNINKQITHKETNKH